MKLAKSLAQHLDLTTLGKPHLTKHEVKPNQYFKHFHIGKLTSGGCVRSVTKANQSVDPDAEVSADIAAHKVDVVTTANRQDLEAVMAEIGFVSF